MCLSERPAIRAPLQYREEEEPTSAAVPPHCIRSDGRMHRQKERGKQAEGARSDRSGGIK